MKQELEEKLIKEYPTYFKDIYGDPTKTCMAFGLAIGDGWYDLFHKLCEDIKATNPGEDFTFSQVKEKFGGLRAYFDGGSDATGELISKSYTICERCGTKDNVTVEGSWIVTMCGKCRKEVTPQTYNTQTPTYTNNPKSNKHE
jgi:hypothetical protein